LAPIHPPPLWPTEVESKDLLESEHMKAVENLQFYQNEMRAWRDKKINLKHIKAHEWKPQESWNQNGLDLFY
jgi:hypothetical protein